MTDHQPARPVPIREGLMALRVDDKWSIAYDPESNDRPLYWLRYHEAKSDFIENNATVALFYAFLAATPNAPPSTAAMTVIDPDQWEPCSPSYLAAGGSCDAPRVWNATDHNHWHPKVTASPSPVAYGAGEEAERIARIIDKTAWDDVEHYDVGSRNHTIAVARRDGSLTKARAILATPQVPNGEVRAAKVDVLKIVTSTLHDDGRFGMNDTAKKIAERIKAALATERGA